MINLKSNTFLLFSEKINNLESIIDQKWLSSVHLRVWILAAVHHHKTELSQQLTFLFLILHYIFHPGSTILQVLKHFIVYFSKQ